MIEWKPATEYPEPDVWILVRRSKHSNVISSVPYSIAYRSGDKWLNPSGYIIDNVTHWAYINPPADTTSGS